MSTKEIIIKDTTVGKLIEALSKFDKNDKIFIPYYPPGDDSSKHCSITYYKGEINLDGYVE